MGVIKDIQDDLDNAAIRIVSEYRQRLLAYATKLCGDHAEAEDLTMQTFDAVFRDADGFDAKKGDLFAWMTGILRRIYAKSDRRKVNRGTTSVEPDELEKLSDADNSTLDELIRNSDSEALRAALDQLDSKYKQVLVLHYFNEFSFKEIAGILKPRSVRFCVAHR